MASYTQPPFSGSERLGFYLCCAAEIVYSFGDAVGLMPWTRLIESIICRRHISSASKLEEAGAGRSVTQTFLDTLLIGRIKGPMAESQCKGDKVQADMAKLMGGVMSLGAIPGLLLVMPFSTVAKHMDRRLLLVINAVSLLCANLFMVVLVVVPNSNLKLLWLAGLSSLFGGGGPIFSTLLRSIIAESVEKDKLSSVLYALSGLSTLVRLIGIVLGSWLLKHGAVAANLSSIALLSIAIPILGCLPRSIAQAPSPGKSSPSERPIRTSQTIELRRFTLTTSPEDVGHDVGHNTGHRKAPEARHDQHSSHDPDRRKSWMAIVRRMSYSAYTENWMHLPVGNPLCITFLAITFTNALTMEFRNQLKPWVSTRYGWPIATVGYVLSFESLAGVAVLFTLPWLNSIYRRHATVTDPTFDASRPAASSGHHSKRKHELRVAQISLVFGAMGAFIIALAADRVIFVMGILIFTGAVGFPDAVRAFCTSFFATDEIQPLYAAVTTVEMLGGIVASPIWGWIFAQAYHGGGYWMGTPFLVCAALLLSMMGLLLRLRS